MQTFSPNVSHGQCSTPVEQRVTLEILRYYTRRAYQTGHDLGLVVNVLTCPWEMFFMI